MDFPSNGLDELEVSVLGKGILLVSVGCDEGSMFFSIDGGKVGGWATLLAIDVRMFVVE